MEQAWDAAALRLGSDRSGAYCIEMFCADHQGRRVDRLPDHWNLALVDLEIDNFPGLFLFPAQFLLHLPFKILGRHLTGSVQPDCTFESLPIPPRQLR